MNIKHRVNRCCLVVLGLLLGSATLHGQIQPVNRTQFFTAPDRAATLAWTVAESATMKGTATVTDYAQRTIMETEVRLAGAHRIEITLTLPAGFHEITLPDRSVWGLVALPAQDEPRDSFFCMDGALSWLVQDSATREELLTILKRGGIETLRERVSWRDIHPAPDRWQWQTRRRYDDFRQTRGREGVKVLDMVGNTPPWLAWQGKNPYPADLLATADSWTRIAERWGNCWLALEMWNEPDIFFGGYMPADQYVPMAKAIHYAYTKGGISTPLVGGVFTDRCPVAFRRSCAENGLLEHVAAISFHSYFHADRMESMVADHREWLQSCGKDSMPLWISESGRPWTAGPSRPPIHEDVASALDITMKAVEARACGIARYFAFVYVFYEEAGNNYGMMGREVTPLRALAAYFQAVRVLSHKPYVGDLRVDDPAIKRARVFRGTERSVVVLYTGRADGNASVAFKWPAIDLQGIDGRRLVRDKPDAVPVPDGLTYAWINNDDLSNEALNTESGAARLHAIAQWPVPRLSEPSPIVLQHVFHASVPATSPANDLGRLTPSTLGYLMPAGATSHLRLPVRVFNLSDQPGRVELLLSYRTGSDDRRVDPVHHIDLPATGFREVEWAVELGSGQGYAEAHTLTVMVRTNDFIQPEPLVFDVIVEKSLEAHLGDYREKISLPIHEMDRWQQYAVVDAQAAMSVAPDGHWRLEAFFPGKDMWAFPKFDLPEQVDLAQAEAILIRARCAKPAEPRLIFWEEDGSTYFSKDLLVPSDDQWHTTVIPLSAQAVMPRTTDENDHLDWSQVRHVSVGLYSLEPHNVLMVGEIWIVGNSSKLTP